MPVSIIISNVESRIAGFLPDNVQDELYNALSYTLEGIEYSPLCRNKVWNVKEKKFDFIIPKWDGVTRLYKPKRGQTFYTGLLSTVIDVLTKNKVDFVKTDMRERPAINMSNLVFTPQPGYLEREYQQKCINAAYSHTRGILKVATGGGKTVIMTELISRIKTGPFMFYVLTKDLMNQAHDVLSRFLNVPIGRIGDGECDIQMLNVCTIQTAVRAINLDNKAFKISDYQFDEEDAEAWKKSDVTSVEKMQAIRSLISSAKGIYMDECHHASATTVRDVLSASPMAYWRYGGSATPIREDGAEMMIQALFGKNIVDINASWLIKHGYLCTPYIIFEPIKHDLKLHSWKAIYKYCVAGNQEFNAHIADTAKYLMAQGLITLILVQQKIQGKAIQEAIPNIPFITGDTPSKKRKEAIEALRSKNIPCLICTTLADEGLDIPCLDIVLMAGGGASATRVNQRIGRTLRIDPKDPNHRNKSVVVYYEHDAKYLDKHAKKARKIIKSEPLFNILSSAGPLRICDEIGTIMNVAVRNKSLFS